MKQLSADDRSQLAGEYVLGTLRGSARRRFERVVQDDPLLWQEVAFWERKLGALGEALPEVAPPERVWRAIEDEIALPIATAPPPLAGSLWNGLAFWRGLGLAASAAAVALLVVLLLPGAAEGPLAPTHFAILESESDGAAWLARIDAGGGSLALEPLRVSTAPAERSYELWLLRDNDQAPLSLGVVEGDARHTVRLATGIDAATGLAISIEPEGGSPTGAPTGPVVFAGSLTETDPE